MRDLFESFYEPSKADFEQLWNSGLFVLDANVLLHLYRLPERARNDLFGILDQLKDRLWIPYQFALEFQINRQAVMIDVGNSPNQLEATLKRVLGEIKSDMNLSGFDAENDLHLKAISDQFEALIKAANTAEKDARGTKNNDPIGNRINDLLAGRVGPAPPDQASMVALIKDGETRYAARTPPGFMDLTKDLDKKEGPVFTHKGVAYTRKFGDLVGWRQTINHAIAENNISAVTFVTGDAKKDWWWEVKGQTVGPLPELVHEISTSSPVKLFWMYSIPRFMEYAKTYLSAAVSQQSIEAAEMIAAVDDSELGSPVSARDRLQKKFRRLTRAYLRSHYPALQFVRSVPPLELFFMPKFGGYAVKTRAASAPYIGSQAMFDEIATDLRDNVPRGVDIGAYMMLLILDDESEFELVDEPQYSSFRANLAKLFGADIKEFRFSIGTISGDVFDVFTTSVNSSPQ